MTETTTANPGTSITDDITTVAGDLVIAASTVSRWPNYYSRSKPNRNL
jgi:hypothetical protein